MISIPGDVVRQCYIVEGSRKKSSDVRRATMYTLDTHSIFLSLYHDKFTFEFEYKKTAAKNLNFL
jgi:hypothetical protein